MTTGKALNGKPYAGNPHVRFDEGAGAPRHSGRSALLYNANKLITIAAVAASTAVYADTYTDSNNLTWTYTANGTKATLSACSGNNTVSFDAAKIPWTFSKDGQDYIVTETGNTFKNWMNLTGALSIPDTVTSIGSFEKCYETTLTFGSGVTSIPSYCFKNNDYIKSVIVPARVTNIGQQGFYHCDRLVAVWVKGPATINHAAFNAAAALETVLLGSGSKRASGAEIFEGSAYGKARTVYMPAGTWGDFTTGNTMVTAIRYGDGEELDLVIDESTMRLTAIPTTASVLTSVLKSAAHFKTYFGLDAHISVTNTLDFTGVTITEDTLKNVTFDRLMFSAKTQAQLDGILHAFPDTTPISIDPTGLTENMVIPEPYNNVYVKTVPGVTIKRTASGFMIIFK